MWAGVDVGGRRKGFHVAVVDETSVVAGPARVPAASDVVDRLRRYDVQSVGVDSPRSAALPGERSRGGERLLARAGICSIRFTPDRASLRGNRGYYDWVRRGFVLYRALERAGFAVVECFPTASWTRLHEPRGAQRRSLWSSTALEQLDLGGVGGRLSQDDRDAIGAAVTARLHHEGLTEPFGEIVVPRAPAP